MSRRPVVRAGARRLATVEAFASVRGMDFRLSRTIGLLCALLFAACVSAAETKPNVIFILADDLGYGDLGCFGQKKIKTPHLDRMATEGMRFTQGYAGTTVCAPSRCALMTGQHTGHCPIRGNKEIKPEGQEPMPADTFTVAHLMKKAGYVTGMIGKWGLGIPAPRARPRRWGSIISTAITAR